MTRDDAWVRFATAAVHINCDEIVAAAYADRLLAEYDKRWDRVQRVDVPIPNRMESE